MAAVACMVQEAGTDALREGGSTPCSLCSRNKGGTSIKSMSGLAWLEHIQWREHSKPKACEAERAESGRLSAS